MKASLIPAIAVFAFACSLGNAFAAEVPAAPVPVPTPAPTATAPVAPTSAIPALFLKPVFLRGTVGDLNVQVAIRPKADIEEGIEGEYFIFGRSPKILLAGEIEGDILFMEESENGTNISGQWDGKLEGDTLSGSWMSADGLISKPFALKVVHQSEAPSRVTKRIPARASKP